jgi:hypothetical protein
MLLPPATLKPWLAQGAATLPVEWPHATCVLLFIAVTKVTTFSTKLLKKELIYIDSIERCVTFGTSPLGLPLEAIKITAWGKMPRPRLLPESLDLRIHGNHGHMATTLHRSHKLKESNNMDRWIHSTIVAMRNSCFMPVDYGSMVQMDSQRR